MTLQKSGPNSPRGELLSAGIMRVAVDFFCATDLGHAKRLLSSAGIEDWSYTKAPTPVLQISSKDESLQFNFDSTGDLQSVHMRGRRSFDVRGGSELGRKLHSTAAHTWVRLEYERSEVIGSVITSGALGPSVCVLEVSVIPIERPIETHRVERGVKIAAVCAIDGSLVTISYRGTRVETYAQARETQQEANTMRATQLALNNLGGYQISTVARIASGHSQVDVTIPSQDIVDHNRARYVEAAVVVEDVRRSIIPQALACTFEDPLAKLDPVCIRRFIRLLSAHTPRNE